MKVDKFLKIESTRMHIRTEYGANIFWRLNFWFLSAFFLLSHITKYKIKKKNEKKIIRGTNECSTCENKKIFVFSLGDNLIYEKYRVKF